MKKIKLLIAEEEYEVQFRTFPAGEEYVKLGDEAVERLKYTKTAATDIIFLSADSRTIMQGILLANAVRTAGASQVNAIMDYVPYGRQDRVCSEGESFSLSVIMQILGSVFTKIETHDIHSKVTSDMGGIHGINLRFPLLYSKPYKLIIKEGVGSGHRLDDLDPEAIVVCPDKGAYERSVKLCQKIGNQKLLTLDKVRDDNRINIKTKSFKSDDGTTSIPRYINQEIRENNHFIISDDICDGGGTFFAVMDAIREINPEAKFTLIFSHGIFSQGLDKLLKYAEEIYVVDDYYNNFRLETLGYPRG